MNKEIPLIDDLDAFTNAHIYIKPSLPVQPGTLKYELVYRFMTGLNQLIGAKTLMNYHTEKVTVHPVPTISIPIYVYSNDDKLIPPEQLVQNRVDTVMEYLENIDLNTTSHNMLWTLRSMLIMKYPPEFILSTYTPNIDAFNDIIGQSVNIKVPKLEYPTIRREKSQNGDSITYLIDPYVLDYGLFVNLTTPFDDMGMSYNALHLYEHLMTKGWEGLPGKDMTEMNGSTYPHGLCYIYSIHSSEESLKLYTTKYIEWFLSSRADEFWAKGQPNTYLKIETQRTISETRKDRNLATMGRSDYKAYDYQYNQDIFRYWSNKPYQLLIISPKKITLSTKTSKPLHVERPENVQFKHLPLDVMKIKHYQGLNICKATTEEVKRLITSPESDGTCGLDCIFICDNEDLSAYTSVLHPLLYCNKLFTDKELNTFIDNRVLPWTCKLYSEASITKPYLSQWLNEIPDPEDI